jgi:hypothetical protein
MVLPLSVGFVQSVVIDDQEALWVLDPASPKTEAVVKFSEMNVRWLVKVLSLRKRAKASARAIQQQALGL